MLRIVISRLSQMIPVLLLVSMIIFAITQLLPGNAALTVVGEYATEEQIESARKELGLDDPIVVQYVNWLQRILVGDLGRSVRTKEPVVTMIADRLPVTIELALISIAIAVLIAVPLGVLSALRRGSWFDVGLSSVAIAGMAIPNFWAGILLIILFSLVLGWLPPSGYVPFSVDPVQNLKLMILPSLTLGTALVALIMRQTRAATLNVLNQDYVRTARSKGLPAFKVLNRHVLRNAMIPVATVVGLQMGKVLGGAVIVETIFSLPGIGQLVITGIFGRDYPVVQASILLIVVLIMLVNMIVDIIYGILDPRIEV